MIKKPLLLILFVVFYIIGCDTANKNKEDKMYDGILSIYVDETYKDVMLAQQQVFQNTYPKTKLNIVFANENECFNAFMNKKAKMIFVGRKPDSTEYKYLNENYVHPKMLAMTRDGIALVVSKNAVKKNFKVIEIVDLLSGKTNDNHTIVFDNTGSGCFRYMKDSVMKSIPMSNKLFAAGTIQKTIDYVSKNPNSIGIIGSSYFMNKDNQEVKLNLNKVDLVGIKTDTSEYYFPPYEMYIATKYYAFQRNLYFILDEAFMGVGTSFANFLGQRPGQLLFKQYHLFPLHYNTVLRDFEIIKKDIFKN